MKQLILLVKLLLLFLLLYMRSGVDAFFSRLADRGQPALLGSYSETIINIVIFMLLLDFLQVFIVAYYRRRHGVKGSDNFSLGIKQIYTLLLVIGVLLGILSLFSVNVRELFTSLSIIFAGLAIMFKDYIANMLNGMIIAFSRQLEIKDDVRIGEHRGYIIHISLQNVRLLNDDDDVIYIPNNVVLNKEVVNYTKTVVKRTSIDFTVDLKYIDSVEALEQELIASLESFHHLIKPESYYLRIVEIRKDSVVLKFQYILKEPNKELERAIRKTANRRMVSIISNRGRMVDGLPDPGTLSGFA
jgi:small-conductance mechanosensitive channel